MPYITPGVAAYAVSSLPAAPSNAVSERPAAGASCVWMLVSASALIDNAPYCPPSPLVRVMISAYFVFVPDASRCHRGTADAARDGMAPSSTGARKADTDPQP